MIELSPMGMPINSYEVLRLLAGGTRERGDYGHLADVLANEFSIVAVILHDPDRHRDLDRALARDFALMDRLTGDRLLFFALVEATEEWRVAARQRHYFTAVERALGIGYARASPLPTMTTEIAALAAATNLGIGLDELPCVVVFRPGDIDCVWFPTNQATIEQQLMRLAHAASTCTPMRHPFGSGRRPPDRALAHLLADSGLSPERLDVLDDLSAAQALLEVVASSARGPDSKRILERAVSRVQRRVGSPPVEGEVVPTPDPENALTNQLRIALATALLRAPQARLEWPWPSIAKEQMEHEAWAAMSTALRLHALDDLEDWSPVSVCYGKALEAEINASVVQDIRRRLGIRLPEFFKRYQPNCHASVFVNTFNSDIDFNVQRRGQWLPPGLGQSEEVARQLGSGDFAVDEQWSELLLRWSEIRRLRNAAAHASRVVARGDADRCRREFSILVERSIVKALLDKKHELRGGTRPLAAPAVRGHFVSTDHDARDTSSVPEESTASTRPLDRTESIDEHERALLERAFRSGNHRDILRDWASGGPREEARRGIARAVIGHPSKRMRANYPDLLAWIKGD